MKCSERNQKSL